MKIRVLTCGCCTYGCVCSQHSNPELDVFARICPEHHVENLIWGLDPIGAKMPDGTFEFPWDERLLKLGGVAIH